MRSSTCRKLTTSSGSTSFNCSAVGLAQGDPSDQEDLIEALGEIREVGWDGLPEDFRLRFTFHPSIGSRYALALGSWDQYKRTIARDVLGTMRSNFHQFPRPW